jgi:hypothetical protein
MQRPGASFSFIDKSTAMLEDRTIEKSLPLEQIAIVKEFDRRCLGLGGQDQTQLSR